MKLTSFLFLALFSLCLFVAGCAENDQNDPPASPSIPENGSKDFFIIGNAQEADNWCWAASIQACLNYLTQQDFSGVSQQYIVSQLFGWPVDNGASTDQMQQLLDGKEFTYNFPYGGKSVHYTISATSKDGLPDVSDFYNLDEKSNAIILFLQGQYWGHAVVVLDIQWSPDGVAWTIFDPWPLKGRRNLDPSVEHVTSALYLKLNEVGTW
jgi:hypothetical protein